MIKIKEKGILFLFMSICIFMTHACKKEDSEPRHNVVTYAQVLADMELDCPEGKSNYFMEAYLDDEQVCYYDSIDNRLLHFGIYKGFTTPSPSFSSGGAVSDIYRTAILQFRYVPELPWAEDQIVIQFPQVEITRDTFAYLDSIFAITTHDVRASKEDRGDFLIDFQLAEPAQINGTLIYTISTRFGDQTDSFIRFNEVRKTIEEGDIYYYINMDFECKLYHWGDQYEQYGLWRNLTGGRVIAKFKV